MFKLYLPAMVANAAPVFLKQGTPLDMGARFIDGKRILGDGKTFEGFAIGLFFGTYTGIVESIILQNAAFLILGLVASMGALLGDILGSFIKRRLGLRRGEPAPILDQLDFVYGASLALYVIKAPLTLEIFVVAQIVILILHIVTNRLAFMFKLKPVPW